MTNTIQAFNQIEEGTSDQVVLGLIQYIEDVLPKFRASPEFTNILAKKKNENQHSQSFCVYMTNTCKAHYNFQRENAQKGSFTIDIGVYFGSILIFTIEAKLLPTPKSPKRAEHEYVYGRGAGIQRFRDGFHGVNNQVSPLSENGLIAYIQEQDFDYWFSKVNQWVVDAEWNESEQLKKIYFKKIAKLLSKHPRNETSEVTLHHFWVNVS